LLERTAFGEDASSLLYAAGAGQRATADAEDWLVQRLEKGCEVVPCPACGNIQAHMVRRARWLRHRWMVPVGVFALVGGGVCIGGAAVTSLVGWSTDGNFTVPALLGAAGGFLGTLGLAMLLLKRAWANSHDPNKESAEIRKQKGNDLAV